MELNLIKVNNHIIWKYLYLFVVAAAFILYFLSIYDILKYFILNNMSIEKFLLSYVVIIVTSVIFLTIFINKSFFIRILYIVLYSLVLWILNIF